MSLSLTETVAQSQKILADLDNVKNCQTTDAGMAQVGLAVMRPLRKLAEQSEDPRFLEELEKSLADDSVWGRRKAEQFARKGDYELVTSKEKRDEYFDYWLTPARTYQTFINSL